MHGQSVPESFRVELDREEKGMSGNVRVGFERLDDTVGTPCGDPQRWSHPTDGLMMGAVDAEMGSLCEFGQEGARFRSDVMHGLKPFGLPVVKQGARVLQGDVGDEVAPQGDIEDLLSATDGEEGTALAQGFVNQKELEQIPLTLGGHNRRPNIVGNVRRVEVGLDVFAARQEHAVATLNRLANHVLTRGAGKDPGQPARGINGVGVALGKAKGGVGEFAALALGVG